MTTEKFDCHPTHLISILENYLKLIELFNTFFNLKKDIAFKLKQLA